MPDAGVFKPARPGDSQGVVRLFAIAARAVCEQPDVIDNVTQTLAAITRLLVPPEKLAAEECTRLWGLFVRVARRPKPRLRIEAGRALVRDLESIGQRLDLPPLDSWDSLPAALIEDNAIQVEAEMMDEGSTVAEIREAARSKARKKGKGPPIVAKDVLKLLTSLSNEQRASLFKETVGNGAISRGDAGLLDRVIKEKTQIGSDDEMLIEVLESLGHWLAK